MILGIIMEHMIQINGKKLEFILITVVYEGLTTFTRNTISLSKKTRSGFIIVESAHSSVLPTSRVRTVSLYKPGSPSYYPGWKS